MGTSSTNTTTTTRSRSRTPKITEESKWMKASPLAILTLALTLAFNIGQMGFTYAHVLARLDANALATDRNEKDDRERYIQMTRILEERHATALRAIEDKSGNLTEAVRRLEQALNPMLQLRTDVEVVKNKLSAIDDTLRRVERSWDRSLNPNSPQGSTREPSLGLGNPGKAR